MPRLHFLVSRGTAFLLALVLSAAATSLMRAATPSSGTLSSTSGPITWDGASTGGTSPDGEATCIEGTTCETFVLKIAPGSYAGQRVRFKISWSVQADDYDVYVHQASNDGPIVQTSTNGASACRLRWGARCCSPPPI